MIHAEMTNKKTRSHLVWKVLEQYRDKKRALYVVFIVLEKAYAKVHWGGPLEMEMFQL